MNVENYSDAGDSIGESIPGVAKASSPSETKVKNYSINFYSRLPDISIRSLSLKPSIFEVKVVIDERKGLYGVAVGDSSKSAKSVAYGQISRVIDLYAGERENFAVDAPVSGNRVMKDIDPELLKYSKEPWYKDPKSEVIAYFFKKLKRGPEFLNVREHDGSIASTVIFDQTAGIVGRGRAQNIKDAERFASMDILSKIYTPSNGSTSIEQELLSTLEFLGTEPSSWSASEYCRNPRGALHSIFISIKNHPPLYDCKRHGGDWFAVVELEKSMGLVGRGRSRLKVESLRLSAIDLLLKLEKEPSLCPPKHTANLVPPSGETSVLSDQCEQSSKENSKDLAADSSPSHVDDPTFMKIVPQPLPKGADADFIKFVADVYQIPCPLIDVWTMAPRHGPMWHCRIKMSTPNKVIEVTAGPERQKKNALGEAMVKFGASLRASEPDLWTNFKDSGDGPNTGKYAKTQSDNRPVLHTKSEDLLPIDDTGPSLPEYSENVDLTLTTSPKTIPDIQKLLSDPRLKNELLDDVIKIGVGFPTNAFFENLTLRQYKAATDHSQVTIFQNMSRSSLHEHSKMYAEGTHLIAYSDVFLAKLHSIYFASECGYKIGHEVGCYFGNREHVLPCDSRVCFIFTTHFYLLEMLNSVRGSPGIASVTINGCDSVSLELSLLFRCARNHEYDNVSDWILCACLGDTVEKLALYFGNDSCNIVNENSHPFANISFASLIRKPQHGIAKPLLPSARQLADLLAKSAVNGITALVLPAWSHVLSFHRYITQEDCDHLGFDKPSFRILCLHESMTPTDWISLLSQLSNTPAPVDCKTVVLCTKSLFFYDLCRISFSLVIDTCIDFSSHGLENGMRFSSKASVNIKALYGRVILAVDESIWEETMPALDFSKPFVPDDILLGLLYFFPLSLCTQEPLFGFENVLNNESGCGATKRLQDWGLLTDENKLTLSASFLYKHIITPCGLTVRNAKRLLFGVAFCCLDSTVTLISIVELFGAEGIVVAGSPMKPENCEFSDHICQVLQFYQWKHSRSSFFSETDELNYCTQRGLELGRLHRVEAFKAQLYNVLDSSLRLMASFVSFGTGRKPQEVINDNNSKFWLVKSGLAASVSDLDSICVVQSALCPTHFVDMTKSSLFAAPTSILHNSSAPQSRSSHDVIYNVFYYELREGTSLSMISRLPSMSIFLLHPRTSFTGDSASYVWGREWITFNSRDFETLTQARDLCFLAMEWLCATALVCSGDDFTVNDAKLEFFNQIMDIIVELIGYHTKLEP
jgi:hypothetical protein